MRSLGQHGATAVEYALLLAAIAMVIIVGVGSLGQSVTDTFEDVDTTLQDASNGGPTGDQEADGDPPEPVDPPGQPGPPPGVTPGGPPPWANPGGGGPPGP